VQTRLKDRQELNFLPGLNFAISVTRAYSSKMVPRKHFYLYYCFHYYYYYCCY